MSKKIRLTWSDIHNYKYEVNFTFFISLGDNEIEYEKSISEKDNLLDLLDTISEIVNYEVENDGEDWCINCVANVIAKSIEQVDSKMKKLLLDTDCIWDYHYIKGLNNNEYWQP